MSATQTSTARSMACLCLRSVFMDRLCRKFSLEAICGMVSPGDSHSLKRRRATMAVSFKGAHFPKDIILMGVRWSVAYPLSYRHIEELMEERGVAVDHSTIQRWVVKYSPPLEASFQRGKSEAGMDAYQGRTWEGWHRHMV